MTGKPIPVYLADYVLYSYGTGAVMAVAAHDERDYAFAKKYNLPITQVIQKAGGETVLPFCEDGILVNSGSFDGLSGDEAREAIAAHLTKIGKGCKKINYRLRDWSVSRQRYWGAPIPMVHCEKCGVVPVPEKILPVKLPYDVEFRPSGRSPLAGHEKYMNCTCPSCGGKAQRDPDTLDTFVCSSWYYLRYPEAKNDKQPFTKETADKMCPVDVYVGGSEHACMHLLYARLTFTVDLYMGEVLAGTFNKESTITGTALEMGKAYNFVAEITPENTSDEFALVPIEFEVIEVKAWDETPWKDYGYDIIANTIYVNNVNGLQAVAAGINSGAIANDVNIVLESDVDLAELPQTRAINTNWNPLGTEDIPFEGVFDGQGFTIKNFNYVADEPVYFVGLFGCAQNATIKNLVVENINLVFASDAAGVGGTIGGVVGGLYGTSTLENITVKGDVQIVGELDKKGAGRIGAVVGGNEGTNKVVVKNVCVEANAGSYVQGNNAVGGVAGQLQGTGVFENCSSNIDVVAGQYFAGGIEGLAAANSTYTNCRAAGNVSVVAGRAGNANDLYRVGGIVGGWADGNGKTLVLTGCSYTGVVAGQDAAGVVAETLDCAGFVGRGYAAAAGSKVSVNGVVYTYKGNGVYSSNGVIVTTAAELQDALDAATGDYLIVLGANIAGDVTANQAEGVNVTIDGAGNEFDGTFYINGHNRNAGAETLVIKNVNFATTSTAAKDFIWSADSNSGTVRYAHNITIDGCSFTAPEGTDVVGIRIKQAYNVAVKNSVVNGGHSLAQLTSMTGLAFENVTINAGRGINLQTSALNTTVKNCNITATKADGYGIRVDAGATSALSVANSTVNAYEPIVLRNAKAAFQFNIANSTLTATGDYQIVVVGETPVMNGVDGMTIKK